MDPDRGFWRSLEIAEGGVARGFLRECELFVHRRAQEWRVASRSLPEGTREPGSWSVLDAWPDELESDERVVVRRHLYREAPTTVEVRPALADRSVVVHPAVSTSISSGEQAVVHVGTPVWIELVVAGERLLSVPSDQPSDTWFGPSTIEGQLCYAARSLVRVQLDSLMPPRVDQIVTRATLRNESDGPLDIERIALPVPQLSIYQGTDGWLWTEAVTLAREPNVGLARLEVHRGAPSGVPEARRLAGPRAAQHGDSRFPGIGNSLRDRGLSGVTWPDELTQLLTSERAFQGVRALLIMVFGLGAAQIASAALGRVARGRSALAQSKLVRRFAFGLVFGLFVASALSQLGFKLGVLFGAAGVLTVAVGFAAQTSASNLVSGLFLLAENPFRVGDTIRVGGTTGEVFAIDLLSVTLRTFDNTAVRIPNESLIKSEIVTLTRFAIRRIEIPIGVGYGSDLALVRRALLQVADENPLVLEEPAPVFLVDRFGDSAIDVQLLVWTSRENMIRLRTQLHQAIKVEFERQGIEIPFPQRTVRLVGEAEHLG